MKENGNYGGNNRRRMNILVGVLVGVLLLLAFAGGGFYVRSQMKEKSYKESIKSAEKYLAQSDYKGAILEYKKALRADPERTDAYIFLAEAYVEQGEEAEAKVVLKQGFQKTNSDRIKRMLDQLVDGTYLNRLPKEEDEKDIPPDLNTASQNIAWNTSFIQKLTHFRYADFKAEFGSGGIEADEDGYLAVTPENFAGVCYYANTADNQNIVDVSRKTPKEDGMPEKVHMNSLGLLFQNFDGAVSLTKLQMMTGQTITPIKEDDRTYIEITADDLVLHVETDENGNIVSPDAWNEIILVNANQKSEKANYSGVVIDAVTGEGVAGAEITFHMKGKKDVTAAAKADGTFEAELDAGNYEITITADGYTKETFEASVVKGRTYKGEQYTISPELTKGTARIVLEWGAKPEDLDSYLEGETDEGDDVFVNYRSRQAKKGEEVIADLDNDTTSGYGPETVTIYNLNGTYRYMVADYRRTQTMRELGATVKVYLPGKEPEVIAIDPQSAVKDIWIVCEIDHGKLNILNTAPSTDSFTPGSKQ